MGIFKVSFSSNIIMGTTLMWYISWFKHSSPSVSHSSSAWSQTNPFLPVSINRSSTGLGVWSLAWRMCSIAAGENQCSSLTQPNRLKMSLTLKSLICPPLGIHLNYCTITLGYPKIGPKNVKKKPQQQQQQKTIEQKNPLLPVSVVKLVFVICDSIWDFEYIFCLLQIQPDNK